MAKRRPRPAVATEGPGSAYKLEELTLELGGGEGEEELSLIPQSITWSRRKGDRVKKGNELAMIKCKPRQGECRDVTKKLIAPHTGTIEEVVPINLPISDASSSNRLILGKISFCTHPYLQNERMCAVCGEVAPELGLATGTTRVFVQGGHHVSVSKSEADSLHRSMFIKLSQSRKLNLILDIDLTLLHATIDPRADQIKDDDVHSFDVVNQGRLLRHWCRLRPGLKEFLQKAHELYVLTIYTHGRRDYAHQVAKLLDPDRAFYGDRIVSRDDCPDLQGQKSLQRLFPGGIEMALILDDSPHVWQGEQSRHLLQVVPFKYYTEFEELNRITTGPAAAPANQPMIKQVYGDPKKDDQLTHTWRILEGVHSLYYPSKVSTTNAEDKEANNATSNGHGKEKGVEQAEGEGEEEEEDVSHLDNLVNGRPRNVAQCLSTYRRQCLVGVSIVFSGVIPRGTDPRRSDLGFMAEALGASITDSLTEGTTHVVAENPNTEKCYHASRRKGVFIVSRLWLQLCFMHCERKEEKGFVMVTKIKEKKEEKGVAVGKGGGGEGKGGTVDGGEREREGEGPLKRQKVEVRIEKEVAEVEGGMKASNGHEVDDKDVMLVDNLQGNSNGDDEEEEDQGEQDRLANLLADDLM